jgi:hypothetical protein
MGRVKERRAGVVREGEGGRKVRGVMDGRVVDE